MVNFLLLASLLWAASFTQVINCFDFNFSNFTDQNGLLFSLNSTVYLGAIQVTRDVRGASIANTSGRAFYRSSFRLWKKKGVPAVFNSSFKLNIQNQTVTAGEGLAFILTDDTNVPENSDGQWLSIVNATTNGTSQANIVAIEFDTRKSYSQDIDDNHVGLDINSIYSIKQVPLSSYGVNLATGTDVIVRVQYDGKNITVFVRQNPEIPVFSEPIDLSAYLPQKVYVGFAASTSIYTQLNCVKSWNFYGSDIDEDPRLFWVGILVAAVVLVLLSSGVAFYLYRKRRYKNEQLEDTYPSIEDQINNSALAPRNQKTHHSTKEIAGTPGYMAPETFLTGRATIETDVYAFGVLILEVACGRKPGNQNEQNDYNNSIVHCLWELYRKRQILGAADSRLEGKFSEEEMECVLTLGLACCHPNPHLRPSMKLVLQVLSGEAPPPQVPIERPSFVWPAMPPSFSGSDYSLTGSQLTPFSDITGR
ncbi:hypothetical protein JRO89_XS12G0151300 [Xanthoceras sorbifolium]|uniref:Protein kinase domain-containing protein n=1 Tax=Xanthoceras sorbifolium TaxID=99658 RepID=A0ABQ8HCQ0_9ROSI|nr:hypothetical protein JRO89_XS12G0151300 [Xanthoceras sorbifolium]